MHWLNGQTEVDAELLLSLRFSAQSLGPVNFEDIKKNQDNQFKSAKNRDIRKSEVQSPQIDGITNILKSKLTRALKKQACVTFEIIR